MTFTDAIDSMNSSQRNAAKRGSMGGYAWKFTADKNTLAALTQAEIDAGSYRLSLVQRDGDQYIYTFDGAAGTFAYNGKVAAASGGALDNDTAPSTSDTLVLDPYLLLHFATGYDWTTGSQADYEASRSGGSGEW